MTPTPRRKPTQRQIHFVVARLKDPRTGELVGALIPRTPVDRRTMRERNFHVGIELRGDLRQLRNPKFFGLAHVLGGWLADNVDGFEGLGQHGALKRLQELSGVGCESVEYRFDVPGTGEMTLRRAEAKSLNFEDMDEGEFSELWDGGDAANHEGGWIGWLRREKWGALTSEQVDWIESVITKEGQ